MSTTLLAAALPLLVLPLSNLAAAPAKAAPAKAAPAKAAAAATTAASPAALDGKAFALRVETNKFGSTDYVRGRLSRMCLVAFGEGEETKWLAGDATDQTRWRTRETTLYGNEANVRIGGERLVLEGEGAPALERTIVDLAKTEGKFEVQGTTTIPLTLVTKTGDGLAVYAYRTARHVFFVAPTVGTGGESTFRSASDATDASENGIASGTSDCGFVGAWIAPNDKAGSVGELTAVVQSDPKDKDTRKRYVVHVSATKTARDPEPIVSAVVRQLR